MNSRFSWIVKENISSAAERIGKVFERVNRTTNRWTRSMKTSTKRSVDSVERSVERLDGAINRATSTRSLRRLGRAFRQRTKEVRMLQLRARMAKGELFQLGNTGAMIRNVLGGALIFTGGMLATNLIVGGVQAAAQYEKLGAVLTNTFGGNAQYAERYLGIIDRFAVETPFKMEEVQRATVKMVNRGFIPAYEQLRKLGDIASVTGNSFEQLVEAILDGQMAEFERLKEFSIKASAAGDRVRITFKNLVKDVPKDAKSIMDAILSLADAKGVKGSMEAIMATTAGQLSNVQDQWSFLQRAIGAAVQPILKEYLPGIISKLGEWSTWMQNNSGEIGERLLGITERVRGIWEQYGPLIKGVGKVIAVFAALTAVVKVATAIQMIYNLAMLANPIGLVVIAIVAAIGYLGYLYYKFGSFKDALIEYASTLLKYSPFGFLYQALKLIPGVGEVMDNLLDGMKAGFSTAWDWIAENFVGPIKNFLQSLKIIDIDARVNVNPTTKKPKGNTPKTTDSFFTKLLNNQFGATAGKVGGGSGTGNSGGAGGTITKQSGDLTSSRSGKHIVINIDKLVETFNVNTNNFQESASRIREEVSRVLMDAVNDQNYAI